MTTLNGTISGSKHLFSTSALAGAQARQLTLGQAINTILGDWADALDGKTSPFGSTVMLGNGLIASFGEEQRQKQERQAQEAREQEERVASTASQWI